MEFLSKFLGAKFIELVPTSVIDTQSLDRILILYDVLSKLQDVQGFDRHLAEFNEKQFLSTLFVSRVAIFLKDKVEELELEPITAEGEGNPDIRIKVSGLDTFIECKNIETSQFINIEEHRNVFYSLLPFINFPHQISLTYKRTPTDKEIARLGKSISKLAVEVTTDGNIINNEYFEVNVQLRDSYSDPNFIVVLEMITEDMNAGERKPGHVFMENGKTIAIHGPEIDYKKILHTKIKNAKKQYVSGHGFITMINADLFLGSLAENIRSIEGLFQPKQNTRYGSVILANSQALKGEDRWVTISNPYASAPLPREVNRLFINKKNITLGSKGLAGTCAVLFLSKLQAIGKLACNPLASPLT